jgi:hypothetical protein
MIRRRSIVGTRPGNPFRKRIPHRDSGNRERAGRLGDVLISSNGPGADVRDAEPSSTASHTDEATDSIGGSNLATGVDSSSDMEL